MIKEMDKEYTNGGHKAITKESFWMTWDMVMGKCIGPRTLTIKDSGDKGHSQEQAKFGKMEKLSPKVCLKMGN